METITSRRIEVAGVVQGVGFRPFVYSLALERGLSGWVNNTAAGVTIIVEGTRAAVERFVEDVRENAPAMAVVESVTSCVIEPSGFVGFEIRESEDKGGLTLVSPDIATCPQCLAEMDDPSDRRHGYPFTNCTNCGPRFTIVGSLPYDRPGTSMKDFPMCPECAAEYRDPMDRRFHAQPNACAICGPRLYLNGVGAEDGFVWRPAVETVPRPHRDRAEETSRTRRVIDAAAEQLLDGHVLAIKGLGGFHLACDATSEEAVTTLRERKRRYGKPLAVMVPDAAAARRLCVVDEDEAALLSGTRRPIVLLRRRVGEAHEVLAPSVAPGVAEIGVMLPYTPLHHLLLDAVGGRPLVMTSGNVSDEPIAIENSEALARLGAIADGFLLHDRPILQRYDDSVVRIVAGRMELVRRSRGYAPFPLRMPHRAPMHVLATGPEQKSTFCLARDGYAFVSQHIGDLENLETLESWERTLRLYEEMFHVRPEVVAYDLHPEYLASKHALALGLPAVGVQHHHAHIAAVTAEHGVSEPVIGLAYDGTGYGTDGTIWGGEVLLADWKGFERIAHLRPVPMPGGAAAVRRPARMASGLLLGTSRGLFEHPGASILRRSLTNEEHTMISIMVTRGLNSPRTSSMGRLFDAVAALTGLRSDAAYEGQAAIELEAVADRSETGSYRFDLLGDEPRIIDHEPVLSAILDDIASGVTTPVISARFHDAVAEVSVRVAVESCRRYGARHVACAGGVFMNRILLERVIRGVEDAGLIPLVHRELPVNDGDISFGQAVVACARHDAV